MAGTSRSGCRSTSTTRTDGGNASDPAARGRSRPGPSSPPTSTSVKRTTRASSALDGPRRGTTTRIGVPSRSRSHIRLKPILVSLVAPLGPPVRATEELRAVEILRTPAGDTVIRPRPEHGRLGAAQASRRARARTVTLRHAEVLDPDGTLYTANLRGAAADRPLHAQGRRRRDVRTALHLPRLPLRRVDAASRATPTLDALTGIVAALRHSADRHASSAPTR